jgi:hypothetical protein
MRANARRKKILEPLEPPYKRLRPMSYFTVESVEPKAKKRGAYKRANAEISD